MRDIQIIEYKKGDLKSLLSDEQFWKQPRLPITRRRAISHMFNPRAHDSDTVLITAISKGQLVAYIGVLPDILTEEGDNHVKFGWLSTWWVDKEREDRML